ncbi:MAG: response regulator transcription factor [Solirubrobacterales bacterium]|nr:response regulator transcription factor [Solirubrobacterales bacterium]
MSGHTQVAAGVSADAAPQPVAEPIRVVVVDRHALMRRSLRLLLESERDVEVVAEAHDLTRAVRRARDRRPRVLVLDLAPSSTSSLRSLRERLPRTQIVVVTMEESPAFAQRALAAGALGFVAKDRADTDLLDAVRAAARDEEYVSPHVAARLAALHRARTGSHLTLREVEVLRQIALGHTSVEIARKLRLSPRTIETHRAHIQRKLGVRTRAELVRYALRRGLLCA